MFLFHYSKECVSFRKKEELKRNIALSYQKPLYFKNLFVYSSFVHSAHKEEHIRNNFNEVEILFSLILFLHILFILIVTYKHIHVQSGKLYYGDVILVIYHFIDYFRFIYLCLFAFIFKLSEICFFYSTKTENPSVLQRLIKHINKNAPRLIVFVLHIHSSQNDRANFYYQQLLNPKSFVQQF